MPVKALSSDHREALALEDMHGFFPVPMLAGMPTDRNFSLQHIASHRGEAELIGNHELDLRILWRSDPRNVPITRHKS